MKIELRNTQPSNLRTSSCASTKANMKLTAQIRIKDAIKFSIENRLSMGAARIQRTGGSGSRAYLFIFGTHIGFRIPPPLLGAVNVVFKGHK